MNCKVPSPWESAEQGERFACADVGRLSEKALVAEKWRMQCCIAENEKEAWFWTRLEAVQGGIKRRRQNGKRS